jgi:glutathione S-transferase
MKSMKYVGINEAISADGLRIVIVKAMPSAWGIAAKAMAEFKSLDFLCAHQIPMSDNPELTAWAGTNSAPVVAWNDEPPLNRWNDILLLLERLAPEPRLVPENPAERIAVFGIGHEICGELGFGWNRRIDLMRPAPGEAPGPFAQKYHYREDEAKLANSRVIALMQELAARLKRQRDSGSEYLVGSTVTAADFYWATFSNFVALQPQEVCPINPQARPMFERTPAEITDAIEPILIEHRDRMMQRYFKLPLEL